jgi:hypothetical protein
MSPRYAIARVTHGATNSLLASKQSVILHASVKCRQQLELCLPHILAINGDAKQLGQLLATLLCFFPHQILGMHPHL